MLRRRRWWIASAALLTFASPAFAQSSGSPAKSAKPHNDAAKPGHLLGDWAAPLSDAGIGLTLSYTGEPAAVIAGGSRHRLTYAQQIELQIDGDWGKIAGLKGLKTHVILVHRAGQNAAAVDAGDHLFQVQEVYGGTHGALIHLVEAYADLSLASGKLDLAGGRLPVGEDYASSPLYCSFMNTALCGYPHSLPAKAAFTGFPNSTWGTRVRAAAGSHLYGQVGVYQVRPKAGGASGFDWGFSGTTGAYLPIELGWEPSLAGGTLPGHYKLGFAHDTSRYPDNLRDASKRGRQSFYVLADQMIARHGSGGQNGLIALAGYVGSTAATTDIDRFAFAGLLDQGPIAGRPNDSFGVMVAHAGFSHSKSLSEQLEGQPIQTGEWALETRYSIAAAPGIEVMPDVQYLIHPNGETQRRDALALAVRLKLTL